MKIKILAVAYAMVILALFTGCGFSDENRTLKTENATLKIKIDSLANELNNLKFTATNLLEEAKTKIKNKEFLESKELLTSIIEKYPTSNECTIAKRLLKKYKENYTAINPETSVSYNYTSSEKNSPHYTYKKKKSNYQASSIRVGAKCCDGTTSSATGRGACSHHGGVCEWLYQ
jgi:uncharacterized lipoprotein YehR (DUF1307 family)